MQRGNRWRRETGREKRCEERKRTEASTGRSFQGEQGPISPATLTRRVERGGASDLGETVSDLGGAVSDLGGAILDLGGTVLDLGGAVSDLGGAISDLGGACYPSLGWLCLEVSQGLGGLQVFSRDLPWGVQLPDFQGNRRDFCSSGGLLCCF